MIAMMLIVSTRGGYRGRDNRLHSLHVLLIRACWQMPLPPHSLHVLLCQLCSHGRGFAPRAGFPTRAAPSLVSVWRRPLLVILLSSPLHSSPAGCRLSCPSAPTAA